MASNPVGWFEIYVQDMVRARAFYEAVFATRLARMEGTDLDMWAFPSQRERPGAPGALIRMEGFPSGRNSTLVYFSCADCAVEAKRAADSGGTVFKDKFAIGRYGFIALVTDTEGNLVGLHSLQ
jgi:predicted enzyme related to lactoylglutathione lyase